MDRRGKHSDQAFLFFALTVHFISDLFYTSVGEHTFLFHLVLNEREFKYSHIEAAA